MDRIADQWITLLASAVLGAVASALFLFIYQTTRDWWQSRRFEMHGIWYATLSPSPWKAYERIDKVQCRQAGDRIKGKIERDSPPAEKGRRWEFAGHTDGRIVIAHFFTTTPQKDLTSYGTLVLHKDPANRDRWVGSYVRPALSSYGEITTGDMAEIPLRWERQQRLTGVTLRQIVAGNEQIRMKPADE
jgi:hypothetical protein